MHLALKSAMSRIPYTNKVGETLGSIADSAAAYSLRALNGGDPTVARVRRSSDDAEKDFTASDMDSGSVADWVNGKQDTTLPCDVASAAAAYSLRSVNSNYTGSVVRVRRSSDNTEQDFSDVSLIADWVGSGNDGHVTTWYDQSGNGNNATQSTAGSQPKIVDAGSLVSDGIKFDGVDDFFDFTNGLNFYNNPCSLFATCGASNSPLLGNNNNRRVVFNSSEIYFYLTGLAQDFNHNQALLSGLNQFSVIHNGTSTSPNSSAYLNSVENDPTASSGGSALANDSTNFIGKNSGTPSSTYDSSISEIIIYNTDQSSNRFKIESNINNHYGLYTNANDGFVTSWYDQSGNDNHATQSTAGSQPKIVDGGVLVSDGIKFNGTNNYFTTPVNSAASINGDMAAIAVATSGGQSQNGRIYSARRAGDTILEFLQLNDEKVRIYDGVNNRTTETSPSISSQYLTSNFVSSGTISMFINGTDRSPSINTISITTETVVIPHIGALVGTANHFNGTISEIIIFDSDQSANRTAIETNINNHYDIY
jgi:hypothetical protein